MKQKNCFDLYLLLLKLQEIYWKLFKRIEMGADDKIKESLRKTAGLICKLSAVELKTDPTTLQHVSSLL